MKVAVQLEFKADRRATSAVERALKKHPHLAQLERNDAPLQAPGIPPIRHLTNGDQSTPFPMMDVLALADGVPRSLPFQAVTVRLGHPDFGRARRCPPVSNWGYRQLEADRGEPRRPRR